MDSCDSTMESINVYPNEFAKSILPSLIKLGNCNLVFFHSNGSFWQKYWRFLYIVPFTIVHYISMLTYIVKLFTEGLDPFEKADMIPLWIVTTQELFKYALLMLNRKELRQVIEHAGSIWRVIDLTKEQMKTKNSALKHLNFAQNILTKCSTLVSWQYLLFPVLEAFVRILFLAQEVKLEDFLPFPCVYPFAVDTWPKYLGACAFINYNVFITVYMYIGTNLLLAVLSTFLTVQFELLQQDLINVKPTNGNRKLTFVYEEEVTEYAEWYGGGIEDFIRCHQDVILLTQQVNAVFNKIVFINLVFSTLTICFFAVAAKASTGAYMINNYAAIVIIMVTVFLMCYCSELLSAASTGIAQAAVKNMWYKGDLRYQTMIRFIIMRSQKPCTLKSLNYSAISMKTFNKVLKTTYSYFSLVSQLYDARD